ncbi:lysylphosphatidylglycerol synthase domain-containing protein [Flavobacterium beibuense]|uniref:Lysylphosphatidylglycerol synthase TM region n=1 Tax=Flavobacterium beibuense TaxID=657326 RepID=A0A444WBS4_9FLAO|nr:lysylphosphatidylglycerol synthase domain-containing protein [Flavobacterium beibuense]RYJ43287.1 hypothetical protein NU09_1625 [Flavobacterium beibuense]
MLTLSRKAKQFLTVLVKLLIVGGAFYFIYSRLAGDESPDWLRFREIFNNNRAYLYASIIIALTFLNRFLEIIKWKNLVSSFKAIPLAQSTAQVLSAMTASLFTPNGIGEYAAKALYFEKVQTKNIIFLNLVCNGIQLIIAVMAGLIGLATFNAYYPVIRGSYLLILLAIVSIVIVLLFTARNFTVKGYSLQKIIDKVNALPKPIHRKNTLLAFGRYFCLIHQHYFLFLLFGVHLPYPDMIAAITAVYFLGSSLPTFQLFDFAVRGSVAVLFFGLMGVNEWVVVFAATLQWLLNIVIPVCVGSYFVFRFKR